MVRAGGACLQADARTASAAHRDSTGTPALFLATVTEESGEVRKPFPPIAAYARCFSAFCAIARTDASLSYIAALSASEKSTGSSLLIARTT